MLNEQHCERPYPDTKKASVAEEYEFSMAFGRVFERALMSDTTERHDFTA